MSEPELLSEAMIVRVAELLRVLGQSVRLRLVELLVKGASTPQTLSDELGLLSQQNVSKHLLSLHRAGIVSRRAEGANVFYMLTDSNATKIMALTHESVVRHLRDLSSLASGASNLDDKSKDSGLS